MPLTAAMALFAVLFLLALLPGTSTLLVIARRVQAGRRQAAAVIAGIVLSDVLFAALALAGMAALSGLLGAFFSALKLAAGALLLWLGVQLLRRRPLPPLPAFGPRGGLAGGFAAGFLITLGDAKAIVFYAALLPAFVDLPALTAAATAVVLLVTVLAVGSAKGVHALLAGHWAARRPAWLPQRALPLAAGTAFAGSGVWLLSRPG